MRLALATLACAGCYAPHYPEGLTCATGSEPCPPGQTCGPDNVCRAMQGAGPDAPLVTGDGRPVGPWVLESGHGNLRGVWGDGTGVFAVGDDSSAVGVILQRTSSGAWIDNAVSMPAMSLAAISGSSSGIWTVGRLGQAYRLESATWAAHPFGAVNLGGVARTSAGGAAVGAMVSLYVDVGSGFQPKALTLLKTPTFAAVTMDAGNRIWAVGDQTVIKYEQNVATELPASGAQTTEHFASVWGDDANLYVGSEAHLRHTPQTPGSWDLVPGVPGCAGLDGGGSGGVWCASAQGIYKGTVGSTFTLDFAPAGVTFTAIHVVGTEVYAVGLGGAIWHRTRLD